MFNRAIVSRSEIEVLLRWQVTVSVGTNLWLLVLLRCYFGNTAQTRSTDLQMGRVSRDLSSIRSCPVKGPRKRKGGWAGRQIEGDVG